MNDVLCHHEPSHGNYQFDGEMVGICRLTDELVLQLARDRTNKLAALASQMEQVTRELSLAIAERNRRMTIGG